MRIHISRAMAVAAALAAGAVGLISTTASALPAGTAPTGQATVTPTTGARAQVVTLAAPSGASCAGDTASGGYTVQSFFAARAIDPASITYPAGVPTSTTAGFLNPMFSSTGTPVSNVPTGTATTAGGPGLITGLPTVWFNTIPSTIQVAGQYTIGLACADSTGATASFYSAPITILASGNYVYGWAPATAPAITASSIVTGFGSISGSFTSTATIPASTFVLTATPTTGTPVTLNIPAGATTFSLTGLTNNVAYSLTLVATTPAGSSPTSAAVSATPNPAPLVVTGLTATAGTGASAGSVALTWGAPAATTPAYVLTDYTVNITGPAGATIPTGFPANTTATSQNFTGLTAGAAYTFSVTPNVAAPYSGGVSSVVQNPASATVVLQDVSATRPAGALVMTQVCGSWGSIPAITGNAFFPIDLPAVTPSNGGGQQIDGLGNPTGTQNANPRIADNVTLDSNFAAYPYPVDTNPASPKYGQPIAVYPTHCGLNLGTAKLITNTGYGVQGLSGQYFQTAGQLNQITVVNTDEQDKGWTVKGSLTDFVKAGITGTPTATQKFNSNHFGWNPILTAASGNAYGEYGINAGQGGAVDPLSGGAGVAGAFNQKELGHAAAAAGTTTWGNQATGSLGIAKFDARVKLLIPVWAVSGTYTATLTLSAV